MKRLVDPDALLLQGAADPTRLAILRQLAAGAALVDGICACDFTSCCDVAQPTVSHHLKVLRESGWVRSERRASNVYYWLRPEAVDAVRPAGRRARAGHRRVAGSRARAVGRCPSSSRPPSGARRRGRRRDSKRHAPGPDACRMRVSRPADRA